MSAERLGMAAAGVCLSAALAAPPLSAQTVTLVGADAQGLKFTTDIEHATFRIPLEPDEEVAGLTVAVDDFVGPDGVVVPATVSLGDAPAQRPLALKPLDRPVLSVSAAFALKGDYRSNVVLTYAGKRAPSVPLLVTRARPVGTVEIEVGGAVDASTLRKGSAAVRFVLQETAGRPVAIDPPRLVNLALKTSDKNSKQARYASLTLAPVGEAALEAPRTPQPAVVTAAAVAAETPAASGAPFVIEQWGRREFVMRVEGLQDAGEYSGTLRVTSRDGGPVSRAVTLYVKKSGWLAFTFIFLGVATSWLIRRWVKEKKPRLESLRRIEDSQEDLDTVIRSAGTMTADETHAVDAIRQAIAKVRREVGRSAKDVTAALDVLDRKVASLPRWIRTGREIEAASPTVDVTRVRGRWHELVETYFAAAAPTNEAFDTAVTAVTGEIETALKEQALRIIAEFERTLEDAMAADTARASALESAIRPTLDDARRKADAGRLGEAAAAMLRAKGAFVKGMVDRFLASLSTPPPVGFTPQQWQELRSRLEPQASDVEGVDDPDAAIVAFAAVNASFLREVIAAAERRQGSVRALLDQSTIPADEKTRLGVRLDEAAETLRAAAIAVTRRGLDEAAGSYRKAADAIVDVDASIRKAALALPTVRGFAKEPAPGRTAAVVLGPAAGPVRVRRGEDVPDIATRRPTASERLSGMIDRYDTVLNVALLVIATVLGMSLLWSTDPVWGGWNSYSTAFLWGLGLHQVGGAGFEGLPAVTRKIAE
jgi:hypothetical protein